MIPRGGNGGIKPAILTFLRSLGERFQEAIKFTLLTNTSTYREVEFLMREQDRSICIALTHDCPWPKPSNAQPRLLVCPNFNPSMLPKLGIDVFYCPFGPTNHSHPSIPTVSMVTDLLHRDYPFSIPQTERIWREEYFGDILTDADYVQCISRYTQEKLLQCYPVKRSQAFFTYLPIDQRLQDGCNEKPERPYFIYPANFWVHKNHEVLLIAYRIYRQVTKEPWDLVLTGESGDRGEQMKGLAKRLGIDNNTQFAGHMDETTFAQVFAGASALLYPSLHEGFGIPLLEAMRFGIPIICSNSSSIPEIAGDAAIYVDGRKPLELAAAMTRLGEDVQLRESLIRKGEERLKCFSIISEIDKLNVVFTRAKLANSLMARSARALRRCRKRIGSAFQTARTIKNRCSWQSLLKSGRDAVFAHSNRLVHRRLGSSSDR
jgi:Glycosyltransferase